MGRPLGTERSPIDPLARHARRQTESKMPVERLAREERAGGRRRANREERSRERHGPRPEEVRAERRNEAEPSRRQQEAQRREQATRGASARGTGSAAVATEGRAEATPRPASFAESFRAQTEGASGSSSPKTTADLSTQPPSSGPDANGSVPASFDSRANSTPTEVLPERLGRGAVLRVVGTTATSRASSAPTKVAEAASLEGSARTSSGEATEKSEAPRAETSQRWSETAEAERAAAVLRQFRLQLHPALRAATIHLSPAELGRLSIRLDVRDAKVRATVRAERAETLKILEYHLPELEAAFAQQGLEVADFDLALGFGGQWASSSEGEGAAKTLADPDATSAVDIDIDQTRLARAIAREAGVDLYA